MRFVSVFNGFLGFFSLIRPVRLKRWLLSRILDLLFDGLQIKSWISQLRLPVRLVTGVEKHSGELIQVLFVGQNKFPVYLQDILFSEKPDVKKKKNVFIWQIGSVEKRYDSSVDMVIVSCDQFFQRLLAENDFLVLPHLVDMVLDTSKSLKELVKGLPHSAKEDVRKVNKQQFSFEISTDEEKLHRFYYDMYIPTISERIGETDVFTPDFLFLKYLWQVGYELMIISYKEKEVCGVFFKHEKDEIVLKYAGVLGGKDEIVRKGAFSAFYYFFMIYAKEKQVSRVNFEGVRPFFNDGLFQYKSKWKTRVEPHWLFPELFGFKLVNKKSESVKQFFIHNPFIGIKHDEFIGYIFVDEKISDKEKIRLEKKFLVSGVKKLQFISV